MLTRRDLIFATAAAGRERLYPSATVLGGKRVARA
jgi:hypothetical protein